MIFNWHTIITFSKTSTAMPVIRCCWTVGIINRSLPLARLSSALQPFLVQSLYSCALITIIISRLLQHSKRAKLHALRVESLKPNILHPISLYSLHFHSVFCFAALFPPSQFPKRLITPCRNHRSHKYFIPQWLEFYLQIFASLHFESVTSPLFTGVNLPLLSPLAQRSRHYMPQLHLRVHGLL